MLFPGQHHKPDPIEGGNGSSPGCDFDDLESMLDQMQVDFRRQSKELTGKISSTVLEGEIIDRAHEYGAAAPYLLIHALDDSNLDNRTKLRVAGSLAVLIREDSIGARAAAEHFLTEGSRSIQMWLIDSVGETEDGRFVPALIKVLKTGEKYIRSNAAHALGEMKDLRAVPPLMEALADPEDSVRTFVVNALEKLRDRRSIPALQKALADPLEYIRMRAASALAKMGDPSGIPVLIENLDSPDKNQAILALGNLGPGAREAVPALLELYEKESEQAVRWDLMRSFGEIRDARALPTILRARKTDDKVLRFYALEALGSIDHPRATAALLWESLNVRGSCWASAVCLAGRSVIQTPGRLLRALSGARAEALNFD